MAAPLILARTMGDAHAYARGELGLTRGRYQIVTSPSTISGRRGSDLYLVPGHEKRHDRFAIRGALRYTRLNVIDVAKLRAEAPEEQPDGLTPTGVQLTLGGDFTEFFIASLVETVTDGEHETEESLTAAAEAEIVEVLQDEEPAKRTRRRRCTECGILVEPEDVDQHAADHLPTEN